MSLHLVCVECVSPTDTDPYFIKNCKRKPKDCGVYCKNIPERGACMYTYMNVNVTTCLQSNPNPIAELNHIIVPPSTISPNITVKP